MRPFKKNYVGNAGDRFNIAGDGTVYLTLVQAGVVRLSPPLTDIVII